MKKSVGKLQDSFNANLQIPLNCLVLSGCNMYYPVEKTSADILRPNMFRSKMIRPTKKVAENFSVKNVLDEKANF